MSYIENIKVATGESYPVRDKDAQEKLNNLVNLVYPVGSIYMSMNDASPDVLFGGTWERIQNRFLLAAGESYGVGTTGGESEHVLTVDEMPAHAHKVVYSDSTSTDHEWGYSFERTGGKLSADATLTSAGVDVAGGGQAHNNMPPYLAVYMWKRIS